MPQRSTKRTPKIKKSRAKELQRSSQVKLRRSSTWIKNQSSKMKIPSQRGDWKDQTQDLEIKSSRWRMKIPSQKKNEDHQSLGIQCKDVIFGALGFMHCIHASYHPHLDFTYSFKMITFLVKSSFI